jgi:hypothetical protein
VGLGLSSEGNPLIPSGRGCLITKHLKLVIVHFRPKFLCGGLKFQGLKVEVGFSSGGDPLIPYGGVVKSPNI